VFSISCLLSRFSLNNQRSATVSFQRFACPCSVIMSLLAPHTCSAAVAAFCLQVAYDPSLLASVRANIFHVYGRASCLQRLHSPANCASRSPSPARLRRRPGVTRAKISALNVCPRQGANIQHLESEQTRCVARECSHVPVLSALSAFPHSGCVRGAVAIHLHIQHVGFVESACKQNKG
jgi:hypothetical protein